MLRDRTSLLARPAEAIENRLCRAGIRAFLEALFQAGIVLPLASVRAKPRGGPRT